MTKIATPISRLFEEGSWAKELVALSDCLECREETFGSEEGRQELFHFDRDLTRPWNKKDRDFFKSAFSTKKEIKLASFHMGSSYTEPLLVEGIFYPGGAELSPEEMRKNARDNTEWIKRSTGRRNIKIALENNNFYPTPAYKHVAEPDFINRMVKDNGISFLFDIAHARISAYNKKQDYRHYVERLPLDRMIQVHISREGINKNGLAYDAHELPDESVFKELKILIKRFSPRYLTLEYYKDKEGLATAIKECRRFSAKPKESMV